MVGVRKVGASAITTSLYPEPELDPNDFLDSGNGLAVGGYDGDWLVNDAGEGIGAMNPGVGGDPVELDDVELVCW